MRSLRVHVAAFVIIVSGQLATVRAVAEETLSADERTVLASHNGKYRVLLQKLHVPSDSKQFGKFVDLGYRSRSDYTGQGSLKRGFWVYVAPYWYVWKESHPGEQTQVVQEVYQGQLRTRSGRPLGPPAPILSWDEVPEIDTDDPGAPPPPPSFPKSWKEALASLTDIQPTTRKKLTEREFFSKILNLIVAPNGDYLAVVLEDGTIRILDIKSVNNKQPTIIRRHGSNIIFTPDSQSLIVTNGEGLTRWSVADGKEISGARFAWTKPKILRSIVLSRDARYAVTSGCKGTARNERVALVEGFLYEGGHVGIPDERLYVYDLHAKKMISSFVPKATTIVKFVSPAKKLVYVRDYANKYHVWNFADDSPLDPIAVTENLPNHWTYKVPQALEPFEREEIPYSQTEDKMWWRGSSDWSVRRANESIAFLIPWNYKQLKYLPPELKSSTAAWQTFAKKREYWTSGRLWPGESWDDSKYIDSLFEWHESSRSVRELGSFETNRLLDRATSLIRMSKNGEWIAYGRDTRLVLWGPARDAL